MPDMTADDLKEHLKLIKAATTEDLDELLHDLLVRVYPSKKTQDSYTHLVAPADGAPWEPRGARPMAGPGGPRSVDLQLRHDGGAERRPRRPGPHAHLVGAGVIPVTRRRTVARCRLRTRTIRESTRRAPSRLARRGGPVPRAIRPRTNVTVSRAGRSAVSDTRAVTSRRRMASEAHSPTASGGAAAGAGRRGARARRAPGGRADGSGSSGRRATGAPAVGSVVTGIPRRRARPRRRRRAAPTAGARASARRPPRARARPRERRRRAAGPDRSMPCVAGSAGPPGLPSSDRPPASGRQPGASSRARRGARRAVPAHRAADSRTPAVRREGLRPLVTCADEWPMPPRRP